MLPKISYRFQVRLQDLRRIAAQVLVAAAIAGLAPALLFAQAASQLITNRLTQPIDESARLTLKGTLHPLANAANDRGAAPDSMQLDRIQVLLQRSPAQESALKQLISDMHTPGSASYHKWLTPDQFGAQFGPSDQDIATLSAWLQSKGFSVTKVNPGKQTLEMSGTVAQFRAAFNTQIRKYSVDGQIHYANATNPQIPAALAPVFGGFASLNNFHVQRYARVLGKATYNPKTDKAAPQWTIGPGTPAYENSYVVAPGDFAVQYDLPNSSLNSTYTGTTYDGTGQTIAIVNDSNINIYLVNQFRQLFGLPANPPQVVIDGNDPGVDGINNPDGPNGDSVEAYLDVEEAGAVAPGATVDLVIAADTALDYGLLLAAEHVVYGNIAPVVSMSFGECEQVSPAFNQIFNSLWEQAAAQGITVMVSSGDGGSATCDRNSAYAVQGQTVNGWGSSPYNVSIGGTDFFYSSYNQSATAVDTQLATYWSTTPTGSPAVSIKGVIPEQPWDDSQYGLNLFSYYDSTGSTVVAGGGGGASNCATVNTSGACAGGYAKPAYQTALSPDDHVRDLPDLSLYAADGANGSYYPECYQDGDCQPVSSGDTVQITGVGGTSASSPAFAGIMALINQKYGRQGQADYVLYPLKQQYAAAFHDVLNGTNAEPCLFATSLSATPSVDCIGVSNPIILTDSNTGETFTEGETGTGTTAEYNAGAGYNLATGLGSVDAATMLADWNKVTFTSTTTTLTPSSTSFAHGTAITVSGSVTPASGTATGNVALMTDSSEPLQQGQTTFPLTSGSYSGSVNYLPGGTYNIWGNYSGDGTNSAGTSTKTQITVSPEASNIDFAVLDSATGVGGGVPITSGTTNIPYGTQLILSAQPVPSTYYTQCVAPATPPSSCSSISFSQPTGTVTFTDSGATINTAQINANGDAEYNAPWSIGSHSVTATYSGDNSYNTSTAGPFTFSIAKEQPEINAGTILGTNSGESAGIAGQSTTVLIQVLNPANLNSENTFNVGYSVPVAAPTGSVSISGGPSGLPATATLSSNVDAGTYSASSIAQVTFPASTPSGTYTLTISYGGDSNYSAAPSVQVPVVIGSFSGTASSITATASGSISPSTSVTLTGTVTGATGGPAPTNAGGGVLVIASGYEVGQASLVAGTGNSSTFTAVLNSQTLTQGANYISVYFEGDNTYNPSSYTLSLPVNSPLSDFTLVPASASLSVPSATAVTDVVTIGSANGFSGNVNLSCAGAGGVECSLSSSTATLTAGGSAAVTLTITNNNVATAGIYNIILTASDAATGEYVHTLGIPVNAAVTALPPGLTLTGPSGITIQNPGDSGTGTLTVTPSGGLTGNTSFTCTIQGTDTTGITCSAPNTVGNSLTSTLTVTTTSAAASGNYTASVVATLDGQTATAPIPVVINAAAGIGFSPAPSAITIASPGASGTSTITLASVGGFTGTVNLSCSVTSSPTGAVDPPTASCPSSVSVTATTPATATLTVTTTAASSSALTRPLDKFFAVGGGIAVAGLLLFTIPARRRSWRSILGILVFAAMVGAGIGCGGGSSNGGGGGGNSGTTTGAYVVTVTATSGTITNSTTVNVTVN